MIEQIYGTLPNHWKMACINDLIENNQANLQTGPFGTMLHASAYQSTGTPVVAVQHIAENRLLHSDMPHVNSDTYQRLIRYRLQPGDILFGRKGAVERRALIRTEEDGWLQGSDCIRLRLDASKIDPPFVSYVLGTRAFREWISQNAHGATMPSLNQEILGRIPLPIPPLPEQHAIAGILGALDNKIEVNRRMNATLEITAWAIFHKMFIEDEQVNEWEFARIGDKLITYLGGTPSRDNSEYWNNGTIPWINSGKVNEFRIIDATEYITKLGLDNSSAKVVPARTTVIAITGATLGQVSLLEIEACTNQSVVSILGSDELPNEFVYFWIKHKIEELISWQTGGAQQHINKNNVNDFKILCPDSKTIRVFISQVRPMFDLIKNNCFESRTLAGLRDSLLPKLMKGEVRVKDE